MPPARPKGDPSGTRDAARPASTAVAVDFTLSGSIGTNNGNDAVDTPSYIVLNYIMKT